MELRGIKLGKKKKKKFSKDYILSDYIYAIFLKYQNCSDREQISGCQGLETGVGGEGESL